MIETLPDTVDDRIVIPLAQETLQVGRTVHDTGRVRVETFVEERTITLSDTLLSGHVDVERVPVGKQVEVAPVMREEGDYVIVPVVEERLVVEKRLILVEEIRIRRTTASVPIQIPATRRVMRAVVEREDPATPATT